MTFGARLETIGKLITPNKVLADIGTDHAYLPVLLLQEKKIAKAIAGDIAKGPCEAARVTVENYNLKDKVDIRQGDGLEVLQPSEAEVIAICGMGGSTIVSILKAAPLVVKSAERIVVQPMNGADLVRHYLLEHGFYLVGEDLVTEAGKLYEVIAFEQGPSKTYPEIYYEVGPLLIEQKHPKLLEQIDKLIGKYNNVLELMEKSSEARETSRYKHFVAQKRSLEELRNENNR